jgi:hypothetical protein
MALFKQEPALARDQMRDLLQEDPRAFLALALPLLTNSSETAASRHLLTVLHMNGMLPTCDPTLLTLEQEVMIARRIRELDPLLDLKLARRLSDAAWNGKTDAEHEIAGRILEILEHLGEVRRLSPMFSALLTHRNTNLRAKGALLVARSGNTQFVEQLLGDADARVRANVVEGLWGLDTDEARGYLDRAAGDSHHSVAANALYGLYTLGETTSIRRIIQMAGHESPEFRSAAAWLMGASESARFVPALSRLLRDPDAKVRGNVLQALARVRRAGAAAKAAGRLQVELCSVVPQKGGRCLLRAAIASEQGSEVPGFKATHLVLRHCGSPVEDYRVEKRTQQGSLVLGLILGQPGPGDPESAALQSIDYCLRMKRRTDRWLLLRYTRSESAPAADQTGSRTNVAGMSEMLRRSKSLLSSDPEVLRKSLRNPSALFAGLLDTIALALEVISPLTGDRKLLLGVDAEANATWDDQSDGKQWAALAQSCEASGCEVHAIAIRGTPAELIENIGQLCSHTRGTFLTADDHGQAYAMAKKLYLSLIEGYEVVYQPPPPASDESREIVLQVSCPQGYGEDAAPASPPSA